MQRSATHRVQGRKQFLPPSRLCLRIWQHKVNLSYTQNFSKVNMHSIHNHPQKRNTMILIYSTLLLQKSSSEPQLLNLIVIWLDLFLMLNYNFNKKFVQGIHTRCCKEMTARITLFNQVNLTFIYAQGCIFLLWQKQELLFLLLVAF